MKIEERDEDVLAEHFATGKKVSDFIGMIMRLLFMITICLFAYIQVFSSTDSAPKIICAVFLVPGTCLAYAMFSNITMITTFYLRLHFGFPANVQNSMIFIVIVYAINMAFVFSSVLVIFSFINKTLTF